MAKQYIMTVNPWGATQYEHIVTSKNQVFRVNVGNSVDWDWITALLIKSGARIFTEKECQEIEAFDNKTGTVDRFTRSKSNRAWMIKNIEKSSYLNYKTQNFSATFIIVGGGPSFISVCKEMGISLDKRALKGASDETN